MSGIVLKFRPHAGQQKILNSPARFKVATCGRRFGKTHLALMLCILEALKEVNDRGVRLSSHSEVVYFGTTLAQATRNAWKLLKSLAEPVLGTDSRGKPKIHENDKTITLVNGVTIRLMGMDDPEAARGMSLRFCVLDEYADQPAHVWKEIIRPALVDMRGGAFIIGTPKGRNHFFETFVAAKEKPTQILPDGTVAEPWKDWESFQFRTHDNPLIHPDELTELIAEYTNGSEHLYAQEILAEFVTHDGAIFSHDMFVTDPHEPVDGEFYVTVDPNGFSDVAKKKKSEAARIDNTAISVVKVLPNGHWWVKEIRFGKWGVRRTALEIVRACVKNNAVKLGIEGGNMFNAMKPYLEEYFRQRNYWQCDPIPLKHGGHNKIDRIRWALEGRLTARQIKFNPGEYLAQLIDEAVSMPSALVHDDLPDSLAYIDQIAEPFGASSVDLSACFEEFQPLDAAAGY